jgi:hypothetical protein
MKIEVSPKVLQPLVTKKKAEPVPPEVLSPEAQAEIHKYLRAHPQTLDGSIDRFGAPVGGWSWAAPQPVSPGMQFIPLVTGVSLDPGGDLASSITAIQNARTTEEKIWKTIDGIGKLPGLPHGASVCIHVLGVVRVLPGAVAELKKSGGVAAAKVGAGLEVAAALGPLITDLPRCEAGETAAEFFACAVEHKDELAVFHVRKPDE